MKTALLAMAVGVAMLCSTGTAHADQQGDYLNAVGHMGVPLGDQQQRAVLLTVGYAVCTSIQSGKSPYAALDTLGVDVRADPAVATELVSAATTDLCPDIR